MTDDVILDVTENFIKDSKTNLKLALQVERAMRSVRESFVREALEAVKKGFRQQEWIIDESAMANKASLTFRRKAWKTNRSDPTIWLGSDKSSWQSVWIGLYFAGGSLRKVRDIERKVARLTNSGFEFDDSKDTPGAWKYLDGDLRDWSGERFLTRASEKEGPAQIASEVSDELKVLDKFVKKLTR